MTVKRRTVLSSMAAASSLGAAPAWLMRASAQNLPTTRLWVGTAPGGSTDTIAREIAPELGRQLGRNVIVENRSGAGGNLAADVVAKSAPDGSHLLVSFTGHTINASLYKNLPFDPIADFTPLTMLNTSTSVLVCNPQQPYRTVGELIEYARRHPGKLSMGLGGIGSSVHLAGEAFKMQAKVYIVNIPYRGTSPAVADIVAGNLEMMFAPFVNTRTLIQAGKLRALGVTSPKRLQQFPDIPAIAEALPGYSSQAWFGLFGPARMAPDLVKRISDAARQAVKADNVRRRMEGDAGEAVGSSPEEFAAFVKADVARWAQLVKYSGATPD
ncbi:MAG: tripartite tricarboxylate transporter substrate binding protein [Betaproteobacteria bacterium]|jgi:tripartite-type tricarboxylate transporter receptor subunit TctC|nr:tripartite tricarboxylate transporter substrate binding protein [Betaproteobacteria bacterium]NBU49235.1 tripartite tricarboxylate transporter substrate binding protein [Betaproteobacteria bacterium]NBX95219.1 tripartite tricarboxylate transporter substrate binding protein [Betaproteobacteria bacterium]